MANSSRTNQSNLPKRMLFRCTVIHAMAIFGQHMELKRTSAIVFERIVAAVTAVTALADCIGHMHAGAATLCELSSSELNVQTATKKIHDGRR